MAKQVHTPTPPDQQPPAQESGIKAVKKFLDGEGIKKRFEEILGKRAPAFIMSVLQIVSNDKKLEVADIQSIYNAAATAAVLDLPLNNNLQYAHIIPYKDTKTGITYAQFQMGWKGFVQLAQRTEKYKTINVTDVREGELVKEDKLSGDCEFNWCDDPEKREALPIIGYVSYFKLLSGFEKMVFWRINKLKAHAKKYSKTYDREDGKWNTDFDPMCKKTMVKENLSKWGPLSVDLATAIKYDQAVINDEGKPNYIDNPLTEYQELTDEEADEIERKAREEQARQAEQDLANKLNPDTK